MFWQILGNPLDKFPTCNLEIFNQTKMDCYVDSDKLLHENVIRRCKENWIFGMAENSLKQKMGIGALQLSNLGKRTKNTFETFNGIAYVNVRSMNAPVF